MQKTSARAVCRLAVALVCAASGGGVQAEWVIAQVAPLTGATAVQSKAYTQGMRLYFDEVNKQGGVQGGPLRLVTADDRGSPEETVQQTRRLLQEFKPVVLAGYFGNRNLQALLNSQVLAQSAISLVGFRSTDIRVLQAPQLFSTRAGVPEQVEKIARHLSTLGLTRLALVYDERAPEDAQALTQVVGELVRASGGQLLVQLPWTGSKQAQGGVIDNLQRTQPPIQAVLVVASSPSSAALIEAYRLEGGAAQIYATSSADIEQLATRLPAELMRGVSIAQVVPNPYRSSNRLNKELRDLIARQPQEGDALSVSYPMMEGYVNAKVLVEAMRRTQPLRSDRLADSLRSIQSLDLGGYVVSYPRGSQSGSRFVDLSIVNAQGRVTQ